mgnify:CR=1 FL=1
MKEQILKLLMEHGGPFPYNHVQRLMHLIEIIGQDVDYDREVIWYATHLHDFGAFPAFNPANAEFDHWLRSRKVAEELLASSNLSSEAKEKIYIAIEHHDYRVVDPNPNIETTLVRDADFLDFLGIIGAAREFARGPRDLKQCYEKTIARRDGVMDKITLPRAKQLAAERLSRMNSFLEMLDQESFSYL